MLQKEPRFIFSPNEGDLSHSAWTLFPGRSRTGKARQTFSSSDLSSRTDVFLFAPFLAVEWKHYESNLLDQRFPVEYELDEFIPLRHSAISFLLTLWEIIILLSPTAIGLRT